MATETLTYVYCSTAEMQLLMRTADFTMLGDNDASGAVDTGVVEAVQYEATDEINLYCLQLYEASAMNDNLWVRRRCTLIACHLYSQQRANASKFQSRVDKIYEELERVKKLEFVIPRLALRLNLDPAVSNFVVDQRYSKNQIRVTPSNSPGGNYIGESVDWADWGWEI